MNTNTPIRVAQVLAGAAVGAAENFFVRLLAGLSERPELDIHAFIRGHAHRLEALRNRGVTTQGFRFVGKLDVLGRRALNAFEPEVVMTWMN
ncbi:hypothetical protein [Marinobacterium aestuarii]|nr:hypothetical protein [Marinobacterium aestuarii]